MKIKIFDVEHGQCALVEHEREFVLIDCGHNSSTGWRPSAMLRYRGIGHLDALIVTNADEDHASDLPAVLQTAAVARLYSNPTVLGGDVLYLKEQHGCGPGIEALSGILGGSPSLLPPPWLGGAIIRAFWNDYPGDFQDENNLSLVTILEWEGFAICFPGDMERAGWQRLLANFHFRQAMSRVTVFMASHHGRQNGYFEPLFTATGMAPQLIVISDAGIQHATQETVRDYARHAQGVWINGRQRFVLTTRADGMIEFSRAPTGWQVITTKNW